jgi:hypothetical protein
MIEHLLAEDRWRAMRSEKDRSPEDARRSLADALAQAGATTTATGKPDPDTWGDDTDWSAHTV